MTEKDRKRFFKERQEVAGDLIAELRSVIYHEADGLERVLQNYLTVEADKKRVTLIYFQPSKGIARNMNIRVVEFDRPIRLYDPEGTEKGPFFWCTRMVEYPPDRAAKIKKEWLLEDIDGYQVHMEDLSVDDLLLLSDHLLDEDCSLNPEWKGGKD